MAQVNRNKLRLKRKRRIRKKISGTAERPRLCVFRSPKHVYVQVIDDDKGITLASSSSMGKEASNGRANIEVCKEVGKRVAEKCKELKVSSVVFDKGGYAYHGRVKALADGAREAGLKF